MRKAEDWFEEELSGEPLTQESVIECIKMIQEEVIKETVKECAKNAQAKHEYDGLVGANVIIVDKESILFIADKLIKEL